MPNGMSVAAAENTDTQLHTIRDLMLSAARRGAWLTLGEIAGLTEIGEASISAQLRHLRKPQHGRHRVDKRRRTRRARYGFTRGTRGDAGRRAEGAAVVWEYRVLPQAGCRRRAPAAPKIFRVRCHRAKGKKRAALRMSPAMRSAAKPRRLRRGRGKVSDAEACD